MKSSLSKLLLTLLLLLLAAPAATAYDFEEGGIYYNYCGTNEVEVTDGGTKYSGAITIPDSVQHDGKTYSVTSIGEYAFENWTGLTSITIPNSVTSIGEYAFKNCTGLTSITIPNSVNSIGSRALAYCYSLKNIEVEANNSNYSDIDGVLFDKETSTLIAYPNAKGKVYTIPNSVTSIGNFAFGGCTGLASVTIPNSVTSIGEYAFKGCRGLTSVTIPNSVTSIGESAFEGCRGLTSVTIPNSVNSIGKWAFYYCDSLKRVDINSLSAWLKIDFNTPDSNPMASGVATLYLNGEKVTNVVVPPEITAIKNYTFLNCHSLSSITIPNSVTSIGKAAFDISI